jgi:hypothetical protein
MHFTIESIAPLTLHVFRDQDQIRPTAAITALDGTQTLCLDEGDTAEHPQGGNIQGPARFTYTVRDSVIGIQVNNAITA